MLAINAAIRHPLPWTHWSVYDDPRLPGMWDRLSCYYAPDVEVWAASSRLKIWEELGITAHPLLARAIEYCHRCDNVQMVGMVTAMMDWTECLSTHLSDVEKRGVPTLYSTIERAMDYHGGTRFRLFGVDMEGEEYGRASDNPNYGKEKYRWIYERRVYRAMIEGSPGIKFERWGYEDEARDLQDCS